MQCDLGGGALPRAPLRTAGGFASTGGHDDADVPHDSWPFGSLGSWQVLEFVGAAPELFALLGERVAHSLEWSLIRAG